MSKSSKGQTGLGGSGRKRGNDTKEEPSIFCEKCVFVFQGDEEFKGHGCQKSIGANVLQTKKPVISLEKKKEKTINERVIMIVSNTSSKVLCN